MTGLLDFLQTPESRMGIGLLAAAGPRADGAGFGQRLNEAMGMQDAYGQNQMRQKFMQAQMDEQQRKTQEAMQQKQAQAALQAAIPSLYSQGEGGRPGAFDVQRALQLGLTPDQISKYASVPDAGRQEVARTIETTDAQGRPVTLQTDKFGGTVGQGLSKWLAPVSVNQGDRTTFIDPATMQQKGSFGINMSQSERDASARGWAGNAIQRERLAFDQAGAVAEGGGPGQTALVKQFGKPSPHYRWKEDGSEEAIPGGPADIKAGEIGAKTAARAEMAKAAAGNVLDAVEDARKLVGYNTAGPGSMFSNVPGTDARDLQSKIETIKANLGFDRLQQMRESSPTGGALGAVAVQELVALQSTVASLDQAQSPKQLRQSLDKIEKHYKKWGETVDQAQNGAGGASGGWGDKPKGNVVDALPTANSSNKGQRIRDTTTGKILRSNGMQWKEE